MTPAGHHAFHRHEAGGDGLDRLLLLVQNHGSTEASSVVAGSEDVVETLSRARARSLLRLFSRFLRELLCSSFRELLFLHGCPLLVLASFTSALGREFPGFLPQ